MGNNIFDYKKIVAEELKGAADALFYLGFNQQMFFYNQIAKKNGDRLYFFKDYSDDIIEKINNCFFYSVFLSEIANKII